MKRIIPTSELMLANDGSLYHLRLKAGEVADTVILVGDPARVRIIRRHLENPTPVRRNRDFETISGTFRGNPLSVVCTGIGAGSIDIALNELDAARNIDLQQQEVNDEIQKLRFIRIGTSGALQEDIADGDVIVTKYSVGLDGLAYYYKGIEYITDSVLNHTLKDYLPLPDGAPLPYVVGSSPSLVERMEGIGHMGYTLSLPGFYAPQSRMLRLDPALAKLVQRASAFQHAGEKILNMEMESGAVNALAALLGHESITLCMAIDNRTQNTSMANHTKRMEVVVEDVLSRIF